MSQTVNLLLQPCSEFINIFLMEDKKIKHFTYLELNKCLYGISGCRNSKSLVIWYSISQQIISRKLKDSVTHPDESDA